MAICLIDQLIIVYILVNRWIICVYVYRYSRDKSALNISSTLIMQYHLSKVNKSPYCMTLRTSCNCIFNIEIAKK